MQLLREHAGRRVEREEMYPAGRRLPDLLGQFAAGAGLRGLAWLEGPRRNLQQLRPDRLAELADEEETAVGVSATIATAPGCSTTS